GPRALEISVDRFAGLLEVHNIGAKFFELGPSDVEPARLKHHGLDACGGRGVAKKLPGFDDRKRLLLVQEGDGEVDWRLLRQLAFELQYQRGFRAHGGPPPASVANRRHP